MTPFNLPKSITSSGKLCVRSKIVPLTPEDKTELDRFKKKIKETWGEIIFGAKEYKYGYVLYWRTKNRPSWNSP